MWKRTLAVLMILGLAGLSGCEVPSMVCVKKMPIITELSAPDGSTAYIPHGELEVLIGQENCRPAVNTT